MKKNNKAVLSVSQTIPGTRASRFLLALPYLIWMFLFILIPLGMVVAYAFTDNHTGLFTLSNLTRIFTGGVRQIFLRSIWYSLIASCICLIIGYPVAYFIARQRPMVQRFLYLMVMLPMCLSFLLRTLAWVGLLRDTGIINQFLESLGLPWYNWFLDTKTAFGAILLIDVWQNTPFVFLLLFASLQSVPEGQYEAARIDGAGAFQQFWYVTIPNIKNSLALCALLRTIDTFRLFEKVNVLTGGGPAGTTSTITQYLYNYGIKSLDFGFGSAGAIVMTVLVLLLSSVYIKRAIS